MKKLIAILAVMFVIVGAVFATQADPQSTGNAEVKVTTLVSVVEPTFKLATTSDYTNLGNTTNRGTAASVEIGVHTITTNTLIAEGTTVVDFSVVQVGAAKSYKTYTFSATAENLTMVKAYNNAGALVAYPGQNEAAPTVGNHRAFAVTGTTVNTFAASTAAQSPIPDLETEASSSSAYQIKYTGDLVEENTEIATFTVTWNNDPQAVPGEYEAYITLSVSAL